MPAHFARTFNEHDLDGLLRLYTDDAILIPDGAHEVRAAGIREALQGFLQLPGPMTMTPKRAVIGPNHAVLVNEWSLPNGMSGTSHEVLVRADDGGWRYSIDAPFGLEGRPAADAMNGG